MCEDTIFRPSGSVTVNGVDVRRLFRQGVSLVKNSEVAPVSAMAWLGLIISPRARWFVALEIAGVLFDVTTVTSSSSSSEEEVIAKDENSVGYGDLG